MDAARVAPSPVRFDRSCAQRGVPDDPRIDRPPWLVQAFIEARRSPHPPAAGGGEVQEAGETRVQGRTEPRGK